MIKIQKTVQKNNYFVYADFADIGILKKFLADWDCDMDYRLSDNLQLAIAGKYQGPVSPAAIAFSNIQLETLFKCRFA